MQKLYKGSKYAVWSYIKTVTSIGHTQAYAWNPETGAWMLLRHALYIPRWTYTLIGKNVRFK